MKKIDNIEQFDDLLKQQFDSFTPEPPAEVWQNLSQHPAIGNTSTTGKFVSAVKSMSIVSKAIIALVAVVSVTASVILLQDDKIKQVTSEYTIQLPKLEESPKNVDEPKTAEETSITENISEAPIKNRLQVDKNFSEKSISEKREVDIPQNSSNSVNQEIRTEQKISVIESSQVQTQIEKTSLKANSNEIASSKETETNLQTSKSNVLLDVDTLTVPEIPNIFTPGDDDRLNKEFVIKIENESTYRLRVFDSKANLVFESFKKELHWNGQHFKTGENCESARYFYIFDYQYKGAKELRQKSGYIYLTR